MASLCVAALRIQSGFLILYPFSKSHHCSSFPPAFDPFSDQNEKARTYLGGDRSSERISGYGSAVMQSVLILLLISDERGDARG